MTITFGGNVQQPTKTRILVVEDDDANREFLRVLLENEAFVVATVRDGQEALEWLGTHPAPDLVLLDLEMPRLNGWGFLEAANASSPAPRHASCDADWSFAELRVLDWVSKPGPSRTADRENKVSPPQDIAAIPSAGRGTADWRLCANESWVRTGRARRTRSGYAAAPRDFRRPRRDRDGDRDGPRGAR